MLTWPGRTAGEVGAISRDTIITAGATRDTIITGLRHKGIRACKERMGKQLGAGIESTIKNAVFSEAEARPRGGQEQTECGSGVWMNSKWHRLGVPAAGNCRDSISSTSRQPPHLHYFRVRSQPGQRVEHVDPDPL